MHIQVARAPECKYGITSAAVIPVAPSMRYAVASRTSRLSRQTRLIDHAGRAQRWADALCMLRELSCLRLQPNLITYNANITACGRSSEWQQSLALLQEAQHRSLQPDCTSYNATFTACERGSAVQVASEVLSHMHASAIPADLYTYNASISACGKDARWELATSILFALPKQTKPDAVTYGAALSACEKASQWLAAVALLGTMPLTRTPLRRSPCFDHLRVRRVSCTTVAIPVSEAIRHSLLAVCE